MLASYREFVIVRKPKRVAITVPKTPQMVRKTIEEKLAAKLKKIQNLIDLNIKDLLNLL